jgi:hypothetical protein
VFFKIAGGLTLAAGVGVASMDYVVVDVKPGKDDPRIVVPVPLLFAEAALAFVPDKELDLRMDDEARRYLPVAHALVRELRSIPDTELVSVEDDGEKVTITKRGETLEVRVADGEERVAVNLPLDCVEQLLDSGNAGRVDVRRALRGLHQFGRTDLVDVRNGEEHVRVYVW